MPAPGRIARFRPPLGPGVRVDTHVYEGAVVPPFYDSLIAKVIVWSDGRAAALARMGRALREWELEGVPTTVPLLVDVLESEAFAGGSYSTSFLDENPGLPSLAGAVA
jgi:acetyl-CoA carboxylase biotin carboxylase subunit